MNCSTISRRLPAVLWLALLFPASAASQLPGLPVLQNAFANPGITVGLNYGRAVDLTGYAVAVAWAPRSGRFAISGGVGSAKPDDTTASAAYGGRVSVPVLHVMQGALGVGAFAGFGTWPFANRSVAVLGVAAGYQRPIGSLGVSVHAAPSYQRYSISSATEDVSGGLFRFAAGVDVSFGGRFGATLGFESGARHRSDALGTSSSIFGLGVSYALRRVR